MLLVTYIEDKIGYMQVTCSMSMTTPIIVNMMNVTNIKDLSAIYRLRTLVNPFSRNADRTF